MKAAKLNLGEQHSIPTEKMNWPDKAGVEVTFNQIKTAGNPAQISLNLGTQNTQTINQPQPVMITRVGTQVINSTTKRVIVSFLRNTSDPNYAKVNVHLKIGNALPVHVVSGPTSPIIFLVPRTSLPATVFLQAEGNWGPHPLQNSPSKSAILV